MAEKRRVGRPKKSDVTPNKRTKIESRSQEATPESDSTPVKKEEAESKEQEREPTPLPNRTYDSRPLPTQFKDQQHATLPNDEYQSVAVSNTFFASLERSRQRWIAGEFLEKYWVKSTNRKDARNPPPPNNPQKTWMRELGPCIIIVEPLMLEATIYYSREPALVAAAQAPVQQPSIQAAQSGQNAQSPYGTPYRPQQQSQHTPNQTSSAKHQPQMTPANPLGQQAIQPHGSVSVSSQAGFSPQTIATPAPVPEKPAPDPVIQMLATRASTDRDLKELMKIVATGQANPEQLRNFQKHIDELNVIIQSQKAQAQAQAQQQAQSQVQQITSPAMTPGSGEVTRTGTPQMQQPHLQQPHYHQPPPPPRPIAVPPAQRRPAVTPSYPVVIEFSGTGASQDRFLFPPYSIVEPLGSLSILASFLVFRKGSQAACPALVDSEAEYYEPVTVKIDVDSRHREILEYMKRSVKPQKEVRLYMEDRIRACKRAPVRTLPLRLPIKSQLAETEEIIEEPVIEVKKPRAVKKEKEKDIDKEKDKEKEKETEKQAEKDKEKDKEEKEKEHADSKATDANPAPASEMPTTEPTPQTDGPGGVVGRRSGRRKTVLFGAAV